MSKKHVFLQFFAKITIFACVFCAFFVSSMVFALPAGYTELEYIESTGTQYIDTGLVPLIGDSFDIEYKHTTIPVSSNNQTLCSAGTDTYQFILLASSQVRGFYYKYFASGAAPSIAYYPIANRWYNLHITGSGVLTIMGESTTTSAPEQELDGNDTSLRLFQRRNGSHPFLGAIKKFAITRGTQVLNLIPAKRNSDGEIGMYDTVSNTFFTNAGTGDFIAGPVANCKTFGTDGITCTECEPDYILNNDGGCSGQIKIATTKYVDDEFAPLDTALANAISVVDNVVTQTIAQAGQIATLQNTKQTRPSDDNECPANMKCLLVTDENGVPHWYPIIEP